MQRNRFLEALDVLRREYDNMQKEMNYMKRLLHESEEKVAHYMQELKKMQLYMHEQVGVVKQPKRLIEEQRKKLKIGFDWVLEGDSIFDIHLIRKTHVSSGIAECWTGFTGEFVGFDYMGICHIWDVKSKEVYMLCEKRYEMIAVNPRQLRKTGENYSVELSFSDNDRYVYVARLDASVVKWDLVERRSVWRWAIKSEVYCFKLKKQTAYFITKDLKLIIKGEEETTIDLIYNYVPICMEVSNSEQFILIGTGDKRIVVINLINEEKAEIILTKQPKEVFINENDEYFAVLTIDDSLEFYRLYLDKYETKYLPETVRERTRILGCGFYENSFLYTVNDYIYKAFDVDKKKTMVLKGEKDPIACTGINSNYLTTVTKEGSMRIWKCLKLN